MKIEIVCFIFIIVTHKLAFCFVFSLSLSQHYMFATYLSFLLNNIIPKGDISTASSLVAGTSAMLSRRLRTGKGGLVDSSLLRAGLFCMSGVLSSTQPDPAGQVIQNSSSPPYPFLFLSLVYLSLSVSLPLFVLCK
jgi:hypothetical protein